MFSFIYDAKKKNQIKNKDIPELRYIKRINYTNITPSELSDSIEAPTYQLFSPSYMHPIFINNDILYLDDKTDVNLISFLSLSEKKFLIKKQIINSLILKHDNQLYIYPIEYNGNTFSISAKKNMTTNLILLDFIYQAYILYNNKKYPIVIQNLYDVYVLEATDKEHNRFLFISPMTNSSEYPIERIFEINYFNNILYTHYNNFDIQLPISEDYIMSMEDTIINNHRTPVHNGIITFNVYELLMNRQIFYTPFHSNYLYGKAIICNGCYIYINTNDIWNIIELFIKRMDELSWNLFYKNKLDANMDISKHIKREIVSIKTDYLIKEIYTDFNFLLKYEHTPPVDSITDSKGIVFPVFPFIKTIKKETSFYNFVDSPIILTFDDKHLKEWTTLLNNELCAIKFQNDPNDILKTLNAEFPYLEEVNHFISKHMMLCQFNNSYVRFPPILLNGAPGIGKTKWAKRVAELCGINSFFKNVGGINNSVEIIGTERGWKGSRPGFWAYAIRSTHIVNPLIILDEIDKMGHNNINGNPYASLLPFLEKETSKKYYDICLQSYFDVSLFSYVMTSNNIETIPEEFMSRVKLFECQIPNQTHINQIFKNIVQSVKKELNIETNDFIDIDALIKVRNEYIKHQSIRLLKQHIEDVIIDTMYEKIKNKKT